jgi:hypothetical protein
MPTEEGRLLAKLASESRGGGVGGGVVSTGGGGRPPPPPVALIIFDIFSLGRVIIFSILSEFSRFLDYGRILNHGNWVCFLCVKHLHDFCKHFILITVR